MLQRVTHSERRHTSRMLTPCNSGKQSVRCAISFMCISFILHTHFSVCVFSCFALAGSALEASGILENSAACFSVGMMLEAKLAQTLGLSCPATTARLLGVLQSYKLQAALKPDAGAWANTQQHTQRAASLLAPL